LVEVVIEKDTPVAKERITPLNNPITTKRNNSDVPKKDPPSTRKSVRLSVRVTK
jgi:hypothetical protein